MYILYMFSTRSFLKFLDAVGCMTGRACSKLKTYAVSIGPLSSFREKGNQVANWLMVVCLETDNISCACFMSNK